eukprot:4267138-Pleurochrysis_carterae.AAC.1
MVAGNSSTAKMFRPGDPSCGSYGFTSVSAMAHSRPGCVCKAARKYPGSTLSRPSAQRCAPPPSASSPRWRRVGICPCGAGILWRLTCKESWNRARWCTATLLR